MGKTGIIIVLVVKLLLFVGWCRCAINMVSCDWEPVGKAEIIYTAGTFTGLGGIIGWIDIEDK